MSKPLTDLELAQLCYQTNKEKYDEVNLSAKNQIGAIKTEYSKPKENIYHLSKKHRDLINTFEQMIFDSYHPRNTKDQIGKIKEISKLRHYWSLFTKSIKKFFIKEYKPESQLNYYGRSHSFDIAIEQRYAFLRKIEK